MKTFFLWLGRMGYQKIRTDFKNVNMTIVKSAPKKSFAQKTEDLGKFSIGKIVFLAKTFFGCTFY